MSRNWSKSIFLYSLASSLSISTFSYAASFLQHEESEQKKHETPPWFTGPLLAPSGYVIPKGHVNLEPYLFYTVNSGQYSNNWKPESITNFYTTVFEVPGQVGIANSLDFRFTPRMIWNRTEGENYVDIGDMTVGFDIQVFKENMKSWKPAAKLIVRTLLPLGKYEHMNPNKLGTDSTGSGSWFPAAGLALAKLFHFGEGVHYLNTRLSFGYYIGTVAYVKGINTYGGDPTTKGRAYPGNVFTVDGAIEYSLTQRWVFAMDAVYTHNNKTRFSGKTTAPVGGPSGEIFSLAPAIEYNFNINLGLIGGVWFTVAGRNTARFTSGVIAFNVYM